MSELLIHTSPVNAGDPKRYGPDRLEAFFAPQAVAVIGASPSEGNLGRRIVESIRGQGFQGGLFAVHPQGKSLPTCPGVRTLNRLPGVVDLAIAAVPAQAVPGLLEPLAAQGIHHLIVVGGGFSETGDEGAACQQRLREGARKFGIRVMGPNGLGTFSAPDRFNSFFLLPGTVRLPEDGPAAIISQSGAFLSQILDQLAERGVGVHRAANFGNRVDVGECDLLEAFGQDPAIGVIALYLESVEDGPRFVRLAKRISRHKPVVVCKGGWSRRGRQATRAHSASLAGSHAVFEAACRQAGILTVHGLEALIDAVHVLSWQPAMRGGRVLILSNGGGMGVMLTDHCEHAGLSVPETSHYFQDHLARHYPGYYSFRNPVDLTGSGTNEQCARIVEYLMGTREFDGLLLVLLPGTEGITADIARILPAHLPERLPVVMAAYGHEFHRALAGGLKARRIPVLPTGERAARAMAWLERTGKRRRMPETARTSDLPFRKVPADGLTTGCEDEMAVKELLERCEIPVPPRMALRRPEDLETAAARLGFPLVLKVAAPGLTHKTEAGGVHTGLASLDALRECWQGLVPRWPDALWAERQMPEGLDLMVGVHRDAQFGPVLLFGSGGTYVELYRDIGRLLLPASRRELRRLVEDTRAGRIIRGWRHQPPLAGDRLLAFLEWTAEWVLNDNGILTLDFNPVRLYREDLVVLDAKLTTSLPMERSEDDEHPIC